MYVEGIKLARKKKTVLNICITLNLRYVFFPFITFLEGEQWDKNEEHMDILSLSLFY